MTCTNNPSTPGDVTIAERDHHFKPAPSQPLATPAFLPVAVVDRPPRLHDSPIARLPFAYAPYRPIVSVELDVWVPVELKLW
jgi:hypothetical protein